MKARCSIRLVSLYFFLVAIVYIAFAGDALAQLHGAAILKTPRGPDGTARAKVGDTITATITIFNLDEFLDSITITSIVDVVEHKTGNVPSANLLAAPVTLESFLLNGDIDRAQIIVTHTYQVLPGDETFPDGLLKDEASCGGIDMRDGPGVGGVPDNFRLSYRGQILVIASAIGDRVWEDLNRNGQQDAGEPGIPNVGVQLLDCAGNVLSNRVTDSSGLYLFAGLVNGDYRVRFTPPAGYNVTLANAGSDVTDSDADPATGITSCYTLLPGQTNLTVDAGLFRLASLGDFVWLDQNQNGQQDAGEPGVPGVTVFLEDCAGNVYSNKVTDASGFYSFNGLIPGGYRVRFVRPANYNFTSADAAGDAVDSDANQATGITTCYTLTSGQANTTVDAGLVPIAPQLASLGDFVWLDQNQNGQQDAGEPGVPGVTVFLEDCAGNAYSNKVTDASGLYLFAGLAPGSYRVRFVRPAGYTFTFTDAAGDAVDSDANQATGITTCYTLTAGQANLTVDAGLVPIAPQPASLGDFVWEDRNRNGQQDAGEPGVPGVTVSLLNCTSGATLSNRVTDASGFYLFTGLSAGSYRVRFELPAGYSFTTPDAAADAVDSDAASTGLTGCYTLVAGQSELTVDAGIVLPVVLQPAALGDFVWDDLNHNGRQDTGEPGIPGVPVTLMNCAGGVLSSTVTDGAGGYLFTGLSAGSYRVAFVAPAGYGFTLANIGSDDRDSDADLGTGMTGCYTLAAGETNRTVDAGLYLPGALGDYVWEDINKNGIQDVGEPGVANVQVNLTDCSGNILGVTFTDGNGLYLFNDLPAGSYRVNFVLPGGYSFTSRDIGANDAVDSDASPAGATDCITLGRGQVNLTLDAGLVQASSVCVRPVSRAISDPVYNPGGSDHAVWLPGISTNLIFVPDGQFTENSDGTATLTGRVQSLTNGSSGFEISVTFSGLQLTPPSGSPKKDLKSKAYINKGGPVDPSTWYYYTAFTGTLTGFGQYAGAILNITRTGPAFQIGVGANNKNVNFGASGWFNWTVVQQPSVGHFVSGRGDFNIDIGPCIAQNRPVLRALALAPFGEVQINVDGSIGQEYLIEGSEDLITWKPVTTAVNVSGVLKFPAPSGGARWFYRVKRVP